MLDLSSRLSNALRERNEARSALRALLDAIYAVRTDGSRYDEDKLRHALRKAKRIMP